MIDNYNSFSTFTADVFSYLLNNQAITLSLIGILILYFGYFSTIYQPIRTEKLQLYISGFQFITTYFILQIFIMYFILKYLTAINLIYGASLILFAELVYYVFTKIRFSILSLILKVSITILLLYFIPKFLWEYISQIQDINWILFILISYLSTMVVTSNNVKGLINHNLIEYKEFYSKTSEMNLLSYPVFLYPLRITQGVFFDALFDKDKKSPIEKLPAKSIESGESSNNIQVLDESSRFLKDIYPPEQLKIAGISIQTSIAEAETWLNSFLLLISLYVILTYTKLSLIMGLILFIQLFFALTSIAIEHSIYTNGFLLVKVFPKNGESFICRLMEMNEKLVKVLLIGERENKKFNPVVYYPIDEISKIRYISMEEMLNEF